MEVQFDPATLATQATPTLGGPSVLYDLTPLISTLRALYFMSTVHGYLGALIVLLWEKYPTSLAQDGQVHAKYSLANATQLD